ncbi:head-tail connector protein [Pseudostreptobacillus hongkongensis]|uniref:head-tail connector protein n=1 Tax=Pseudostreptobacillus hongkongensis TaxID=1162717 RepID=UPI00082ECB93|nr:head-tail connector protein [Pseudostreptobacillus hongkongensis]
MNLDLIKSYLRIDFEEDDVLLEMMYNTADLFLIGAIKNWNLIKDNVNYTDKVKILLAAVIQNLYDNRGLGVKEPSLDKVMSSLIHQLDLLNEEDLK